MLIIIITDKALIVYVGLYFSRFNVVIVTDGRERFCQKKLQLIIENQVKGLVRRAPFLLATCPIQLLCTSQTWQDAAITSRHAPYSSCSCGLGS